MSNMRFDDGLQECGSEGKSAVGATSQRTGGGSLIAELEEREVDPRAIVLDASASLASYDEGRHAGRKGP
jgi:hypothetical protein